MDIQDKQIEAIVDRVVAQLAPGAGVSSGPAAPATVQPTRPSPPGTSSAEGHLGSFPDVDSAVTAAGKAFREYRDVKVEQRRRIIAAIRDICSESIDELSRRGVEETGMGRFEDKRKKNQLAIGKTPGVEDLSPEAFSGDDGLTIQERAPYGVIGSITPCTNPSETIICNAIGMIAGGNAVVFNPHPTARRTSVFTVHLINQAIVSAGGPPNLVCTVAAPTISSAQQLMTHPQVRLLVVTGGPAVVATAMKSGKRVIAAGPGNPPVVVDETADPDKAACDIIASSSCDNNIICVIEKEIIATAAAADALKKALLRNGAVELGAHQTRRLEKILLDEAGRPDKRWVGKDIQLILAEIGMAVEPSKRLAIMETGPGHPFAREEMLMPVLPLIRVRDIDAAIDLAYELEGGCFHTAVIHSKNIDHMHRMARRMNTTIFVKNGMALAGLGFGGEGPASFTIASPTGEGITTARHFTRSRRCVLSGHFRIV
jgi:acyl-CoA reductase-like NAD-dependent aldehyde dehydrogenase